MSTTSGAVACNASSSERLLRSSGSRVAWPLLLPTLVLMLIAPPALGSAATGRDTGVLPVADLELSRLPLIPAVNPADVTPLDVTRSGFEG